VLFKCGLLFLSTTFLNTHAHAAENKPLELLTEHNPPLSMVDEDTGEFSGINVLIAKELMKRSNTPYVITALPRNRAYRVAVEVPNTCIIGLIHTADRADVYSWVKPTATGGWGLYKKRGSKISITKLEDALPYTIAAAPNYPSTQSIEDAGPYKLIKVSFAKAAKLLEMGRTDLALGGLRSMKPTALNQGLPVPELAFVIRRVEAGLACNKSLNSALLQHLNETVATMQNYVEYVLDNANKKTP
jgi:polar amino acid transport system substrate-binding protein